MGIVSGIAVYFMIWWISLFVVLPWGNQPTEAHDKVLGQADSAPERPRLIRKFVVNTILATLIWIFIYIVIKLEVFSFAAWVSSEQMKT